MKSSNTSERLKEIMNSTGLKQIEILNKVKPICKKYKIKMGSNDLSQYVTGKVEPSQRKLSALAEALGVSEVWLMGYDVEKNKYHTILPDDKIIMWDDILGYSKNDEVPFKYIIKTIYDYEAFLIGIYKRFFNSFDNIKKIINTNSYPDLQILFEWISISIEYTINFEEQKDKIQKLNSKIKNENMKNLSFFDKKLSKKLLKINNNLPILDEIKKNMNSNNYNKEILKNIEEVQKFYNESEKILKQTLDEIDDNVFNFLINNEDLKKLKNILDIANNDLE